MASGKTIRSRAHVPHFQQVRSRRGRNAAKRARSRSDRRIRTEYLFYFVTESTSILQPRAMAELMVGNTVHDFKSYKSMKIHTNVRSVSHKSVSADSRTIYNFQIPIQKIL